MTLAQRQAAARSTWRLLPPLGKRASGGPAETTTRAVPAAIDRCAKSRLSEFVLLSRSGVSGCGVCDRSAGARALSGSAAGVAGDEMVDGSFGRKRLRLLGVLRSAGHAGRVSRRFWGPAGSLGVISVI